MCRRFVFSVLMATILLVGNPANAELFDPPLKNPSFELPDMGPGGTSQWANNADDWILNVSGNAYLEDGSWFPSPDGDNVFKLWSGAYIWQQIGTWDPDTDYEISMWVGRGDAASELEVSLWAGGNPAALPASGFGTIGATVAATRVATANMVPSIAVGQNEWMTVTLNTGTDFTGSDALWIRIDCVSPGGTATWVDNVEVIAPVDPALASRPTPVNGATDIWQDAILSWTPGETATSHNVYLGTTFEEVDAAGPGEAPELLVSQGQTGTTYDPPELLELGQTYYWRIDGIETGGTVHRGVIWQFTVEPFSYPIENVTATASDFIPDSHPEKTVDKSGLNAENQHSDVNTDQWQVDFPEERTDPVWIQYEFDKVYKLYDLWVWNANVQWEQFLYFSVKDVTIEYAVDPNEWTTLGDYTFEQGSGLSNYTYHIPVNFDGALAKYVRINVNSNYGGKQTGLSEVRFFQSPYFAREPQPASGAANVDPAVVLSWRPGRGAVTHEVYLSADEQAVADGAALIDTVANNSYQPSDIQLETTYYWKVDEVNEAGVAMSWGSDIWNFSTPTYLVVDNFESYNDQDNLIYEAWADGYEVASNGSQVGHDMPPYAERANVRSGSQSMPFQYGQNGATTSEATLTLDPSNWTRAGAQTLVVFFRGTLGNAAGQLYVKVNNGNAINYPGNTAGLAAPIWKQWNIDLASLGNAATNVRSLTIGVSGSGTGMLYFDDIRLYRTTPPMAEPAVDPGTPNLVALYAMENNVTDGSGNGYNGTAETGSSFGDGPTGHGRALVLDGESGHATLPVGPLVQSLSSATFATWVNWSGSGGAWQRIFDFGTGETVNMWLTPNASGAVRFAITVGGSGAESRLNRSGNLSIGWNHIAIAIDGATNQMSMYINGSLAASNTTSVLPMDLGNTTQNWIGRSQYTGDAYFNGSVDDFRIYNRALSGPEVRYLVGDR